MNVVDLYQWLNNNKEEAAKLYNTLRTSDMYGVLAALEQMGIESLDGIHGLLTSGVLDLTHLKWDFNPSGTKGTAGTFLKSVDDNKFYKLSVCDASGNVYGHESVNECLISDVLDILGIEHVRYCGSRAKVIIYGKEVETFVCWSESFRVTGDSKTTLENLYARSRLTGEEIVPYLKRVGFWSHLEAFLVADFLFINRDRHGANIEVLKYPDGTYHVVPMFDNGYSLVSVLYDNIQAIESFDSMRDYIANNFVGSKSLYENISLLTVPLKVTAVTENDISTAINKYGTVLSPAHIHKITEIIWSRYTWLEEGGFICH